MSIMSRKLIRARSKLNPIHDWYSTLVNNRYNHTRRINGIEIVVVTQDKGTVDCILLTFNDSSFDLNILQEVLEYDPWNCFPYIIQISEDQVDSTNNIISSNIIPDLYDNIKINPDNLDYINLLSVCKGKSKGMKAKHSRQLDNKCISSIRSYINTSYSSVKFDNKHNNKKIPDFMVTNGDTGDVVFVLECKNISNSINMTERLSTMIEDSRNITGRPFELLIGFYESVTWEEILHKRPNHVAMAYLDVSSSTQADILSDSVNILDMPVLIVVDENTSVPLIQGPTLRQYIDKCCDSLNRD